MTHRMWETSFASDPGVVGRPVEMAGQQYTVVGIMPPDFEFLSANIGLIVANTFEDERDNRDGASLRAVTTLPAGVTPDQARSQANAAWQRMAAEYPDELGRYDFRLETLREQFPGEGDTRLVQVMLLVALFVLIIAAANVANLLLARAEERAQEIAVRVSLGAGRLRLVRQLLTESTMLALLGGFLGVALAIFGVDQLAAVMPVDIPKAFGPRLQPAVLTFAVVTSMGVGIFFGLAPALQALRSNQRGTLSEATRGGTAGRGRTRLRAAFVVGEIAVALGLLTGAGAMTSMAGDLVNVDLGLRSEGLLTFRTIASGERYAEPAELARFHREIEEELLGLPQTVGVAVMDQLPRGRGIRGPEFTIDGRELQEGQAVPQTLLLSVNHSYFGTMEIPLREGRVFESSDREGEPLVVVVSRAFIGFHFPGESVLGRRITLEDASREIVGVVEDVFHTRSELPGALAGLAYLPLEQHPIRSVAYAIRTTGDPTAIASDLRTAVWAVEPTAPVGDVGTLDAFIADEMAVIRVVGGMMGFFGLLALVLSAMGIYGVMAHAVAQRSREIGIRMALGAEGGTVVRLMLRNGLVQAGVGIVIGLPLALLIRRAAQGISVQFRADLGGPMVIVLVAGVLGAVCLLASYLPARKAAGVDPITALRTDG
jgi:predicted permease